MSEQAFPLQWPAGFPRTLDGRSRSKFKGASFSDAMATLLAELRRMGAENIVLSTNLPLRKDGLPYAAQRLIADPGVAVYFTRGKRRLSLAVDRWDRIEDNMHALELTVEAMRGLERWGASDVLERTFMGFAALPAPEPLKPWWQVLELQPTASLEAAEARYRAKARVAHPDAGGSATQMTELNRAIADARAIWTERRADGGP